MKLPPLSALASLIAAPLRAAEKLNLVFVLAGDREKTMT
jgi:hypothetical protein